MSVQGANAALDIESLLPATLTAPGLSEEDFIAFCSRFPDSFIEYTADGTLLIMPPTDPETSASVARIIIQLGNWAEANKKGIVMGPDGGFRFADGSRRSPDAAWFNRERWRLARQDTTSRYPVFAPEFVIEVRSPDDRLQPLQEKMQEYIANGVQLGWLIDPRKQNVTVYRAGEAPVTLEKPASLAGDGPVAGFVLNLEPVW